MTELIKPTRRLFLAQTLAAFAAPAIVRASSLMPIKALLGMRPHYSLLNMHLFTRDAVLLWQNSNRFLEQLEHEYETPLLQPSIGQTIRIKLPDDWKGTA